jgi:hypothetical protein
VEAAPEGADVALIQDGLLAAINLIQSEGMQHLDRAPDQGALVHRHRARRTAWYGDHKGQIDHGAAKRLCSDHEIGLCDHGETRSEPFGTIYSWVAELGTGQVRVAHRRPCENEYRVLTLEAS